MDRGVWWVTVHGITKLGMTELTHTHTHTHTYTHIGREVPLGKRVQENYQWSLRTGSKKKKKKK